MPLHTLWAQHFKDFTAKSSAYRGRNGFDTVAGHLKPKTSIVGMGFFSRPSYWLPDHPFGVFPLVPWRLAAPHPPAPWPETPAIIQKIRVGATTFRRGFISFGFMARYPGGIQCFGSGVHCHFPGVRYRLRNSDTIILVGNKNILSITPGASQGDTSLISFFTWTSGTKHRTSLTLPDSPPCITFNGTDPIPLPTPNTTPSFFSPLWFAKSSPDETKWQPI